MRSSLRATRQPWNRAVDFIFFLGLFFLLAASFCANIFSVAGSNWFYTHQRDSESLVVARLIEKSDAGIDANGGYLVHFGTLETQIDLSYGHYLGDLGPVISNQFRPYTGQVGLQGYGFGAIEILLRAYDVPPRNRISFYKAVTASMLALIMSSLIMIMRRQMGLAAATAAFVVILFSPWLTVFARNLYWVPFTWFLPMLVAWILFDPRDNRFNQGVICLALAVIVKSLCGFEYVTSVCGAAFAVAVFQFMRQHEGVGTVFRKSTIAALTLAASVAVAITIQILKGALYLGSIATSWIDFLNRLAYRSYGDPNSFDPVFEASLRSNILDIIWTYAGGQPIFVIPGVVSATLFQFIFPIIVIISVSSLVIIFREKYNGFKLVLPYLCFCFLSLAASVSWFVVARGHSFIHTHMNYVLWHLPFSFVVAAVCAKLTLVAFLPFEAPVTRTVGLERSSGGA